MEKDEVVYCYQIWQMELFKRKPKGKPFLDYDLIFENGYDIYPDDYNLVYSGNITNGLMEKNKIESDIQILNYLFYIFNIQHPKDFYGRSMSVSDIVVLYRNNIKKSYYVDGIGFRDITNKFL